MTRSIRGLSRLFLAAVPLVLLFKVPSLPAQTWIKSPINNHLYATTPSMNWKQAEALAVKWGGHLVTIRNQAEQDWLWKTFGPNAYWIGFTDQRQEGKWEWISGEKVTYTNWAPGEPNNFGGNEDWGHVFGPPWGKQWKGIYSYWNDSSITSWRASQMYGIVETLPPSTDWTWAAVPGSNPGPRYGAAIAGDPITKVRFLFGGADGKGTVLGDTWIHVGTKWTQLKPANRPPAPRMRGRLAFDGKVFVLFGGKGAGGSLLGDTWTFNPVKNTWTQLFPPVSPPARAGHILEWDPVSKKVLLFGGQGASGLLNDTWTFSGSTWTKLGPTASPSARTLAASCTDTKANTVVLVGGRTANGALADHWTWNGTTWSRVSSSILPGARAGAGLVYDDHRNLFLLYGGEDGTGKALGDAWIFQTPWWRRLSTKTAPSPRTEAAFAFDPWRARILMGGGRRGPSVMNGDWILKREILIADRATLSRQTGGQINFTIDGGPWSVGRIFVLIGSASGTTPGFNLPGLGGKPLHVPLNLDWYLWALFDPKANFWLAPIVGVMPGMTGGRVTARFKMPPIPFVPSLTLHHTALLSAKAPSTFEAVSDPLPLLLK